MKTNKFGKLQKLILAAVTRDGEKGSPLPVLHALAFPGNSYPFSYITPILLRMAHQQLIKVVWNQVDVKQSRAYLKGKHYGPGTIRCSTRSMFTAPSSGPSSRIRERITVVTGSCNKLKPDKGVRVRRKSVVK